MHRGIRRYNEHVSEWQINTARFSVFTEPDFIAPSTLWHDCVGGDPDTSTYQRANATKLEIGAVEDAQLILQIQPMRIDWSYQPQPNPGELGMPSLGQFPNAADSLLALSRRWVGQESFPKTRRVALGFTLIAATGDRAAGYRELSKFVDCIPTNPDASDFMLQVNIPRPSSANVPGLRVNRLSRWGVLRVRQFTATPVQPQFGLELGYLHLDLDINTNPEFEGLLPPSEIPMIIDDLFRGAKEVSEQGTKC